MSSISRPDEDESIFNRPFFTQQLHDASNNKSVDDKHNQNVTNNAIVIDDSPSSTLQEKFIEVRGDGEDKDFEVECGVCGVLFEIYNGDVGFSFDMHIQNDPQHSLASSIPLERDPLCSLGIVVPPEKDAQNISLPSTSKEIQTLDSILEPNNAGNFKEIVSPLSNATEIPTRTSNLEQGNVRNSKEMVFEELLMLEKQFFIRRNRLYYCHLCSVALHNESYFVHHLLSKRHLSDDWAFKHTPNMLNMKLQKLQSLLNLQYATVALERAVGLITLLLSKHFGYTNLSSKHVAGNEEHFERLLLSKQFQYSSRNSLPIASKEECFGRQSHKRNTLSSNLNISALDTDLSMKSSTPSGASTSKESASTKGTFTTTGASPPNFCQTCFKWSENMNVQEKKRHLRLCNRDAATLFFCESCQKIMHLQDKEAHLKVRSHTEKINIAGMIKAGNSSDYCEICLNYYVHMTDKDQRIHITMCKRDPSKLFFCRPCHLLFNKSCRISHLIGKVHLEKVFGATPAVSIYDDKVMNAHEVAPFPGKSRLSISDICQTCLKYFSVMTKEDKERHAILCRRDRSELFFCDVCQLLMAKDYQERHLKGEAHLSQKMCALRESEEVHMKCVELPEKQKT